MSYYMPYWTSVSPAQSSAVYTVLSQCIPCNIMCMTLTSPGHVRYNHVHRFDDRIVAISMQRGHRRADANACYYVYITDLHNYSSEGLVVPYGHFPVSMMSGISAELVKPSGDVPVAVKVAKDSTDTTDDVADVAHPIDEVTQPM
ncbi:hypothetical protein FKP32DRAFT_1677745 [Trametes sanguinea]|nr:hypothetical protein FKP32DRAFT_1677745 [Trametes sanguinea]